MDEAGWERVLSPQSSVFSQTGVAGSQSPVPSQNDLLVFSATAKAFCHQMVRSMVALCVNVRAGPSCPGRGLGDLRRRIERRQGRSAAPWLGSLECGLLAIAVSRSRSSLAED